MSSEAGESSASYRLPGRIWARYRWLLVGLLVQLLETREGVCFAFIDDTTITHEPLHSPQDVTGKVDHGTKADRGSAAPGVRFLPSHRNVTVARDLAARRNSFPRGKLVFGAHFYGLIGAFDGNRLLRPHWSTDRCPCDGCCVLQQTRHRAVAGTNGDPVVVAARGSGRMRGRAGQGTGRMEFGLEGKHLSRQAEVYRKH